MSSFGLEGQLVFAQNTTEQNQQSENTDNSNIIVDENGLTAVLPSDNVDVNLNNGLIAVVPGAILPTVQTIQTDVTETQPSGLIGVVPNPEQENLPTAEVSDVSISEVLTNNVQEAVTESVEVSEEIPEPVEQGEISFDEQVVEESSDVAYIDADVKQTPSNVIDYVQDAIQNTIYETPAPVIQQTIGIAENPENATTVVEPYSDTADVLLEESTNNEVVLEESESIQKVTITVAEKTEDAVPDTVFEVKTQTLADSTVSKIEALIPTDIEAVEAIFEYDNSFTAKNSFIGDLMRIPQPSPSPEEVTEGVAREVPNTTTSDVEPAVEIETSTEEIKEETVVDIVQETAEEIAEETAEEITEEVTKETPPEQTAPDLTTLAIGTQFMGELNLNDSTENVLATDLSEAVFHTYQIDVPQGQEVLTISVEGKSGDVDFAVKAGSEITSYTEVDYIDNSGSAIASYSYQFPPSGPVFIDVMNYTNEPVAYLLTTSDDYADAVSTSYDGFDGSREDLLAVRNNAGGNLAGPLETGEFFDLSLNSVLNREIAAKEPSATRVYHSYKVALPKALDNVEVALDGQGHDVDMAVRLGEPIVRLDEVDFIDNSSDSTATYQFKTVEDTVVYIDVMNHLHESAHYELLVVAEGVELETTASETENVRSYAPNVVPTQVDPNVTILDAGQHYEGSIANYLKIGQELSAMAESQSFLIQVPENKERFVVILKANEDLDLALKYASPIESYALKKQGGDWDYLDMRPTTHSRLQVDAPQAGYWYIDVIQATYGQGAAPYTLQVFYP